MSLGRSLGTYQKRCWSRWSGARPRCRVPGSSRRRVRPRDSARHAGARSSQGSRSCTGLRPPGCAEGCRAARRRRGRGRRSRACRGRRGPCREGRGPAGSSRRIARGRRPPSSANLSSPPGTNPQWASTTSPSRRPPPRLRLRIKPARGSVIQNHVPIM
jgi:hypothetical protein